MAPKASLTRIFLEHIFLYYSNRGSKMKNRNSNAIIKAFLEENKAKLLNENLMDLLKKNFSRKVLKDLLKKNLSRKFSKKNKSNCQYYISNHPSTYSENWEYYNSCDTAFLINYKGRELS